MTKSDTDLRSRREAQNLSREEMAERAGVDASTISRWELHGLPSRGPGRVLISQLYGVTANDFAASRKGVA